MSEIDAFADVITLRRVHNAINSSHESCKRNHHNHCVSDITEEVATLLPPHYISNEFKAYAQECHECGKWKFIRLVNLNCKFINGAVIRDGIRIEPEFQHHDFIANITSIRVYQQYQSAKIDIRYKLCCKECGATIDREHFFSMTIGMPINFEHPDLLCNVLKNVVAPIGELKLPVPTSVKTFTESMNPKYNTILCCDGIDAVLSNAVKNFLTNNEVINEICILNPTPNNAQYMGISEVVWSEVMLSSFVL